MIHHAIIHPNLLVMVSMGAGAPGLEFLQKSVGGYIEIVPMFDTFEHDGKRYPCVAFCDEEGKLKDKEPNIPATIAWDAAIFCATGQKGWDVLCGDIVVIFADDRSELDVL